MPAQTAPDPEAMRVARLFLARIAGAYPIVEAWLYGSRARGDARPDSDVDVAVVIEGPRREVRRLSGDLAAEAFDELLDTGLLVSPLAISAEDWRAPDGFSNPFLLHNIKREGIPI
ncbi:MAG TPA: nucleotidyltransferase domain-containing protein [Sphingomonas sp.]|nr:nucleotidyltransferase domain-containing protein [Sphingomonas sp.]